MPMNRAYLLATAGAAMLAGCGSNEGYPSLARRAAERYAEAAPPPAPPVAKGPEVLDSQTSARIASLLEQARAGHAAFAAQLGATTAAVSTTQGAAAGSEAWARASTQLGLLESKRAPVTLALADLDQIHVDLRVNGGDGSSIAAVRDQITAWVADEDAVLADLKSRLAP